ncbi:MAG: SusC/RagA family TonB-linked outer membrane protein, partial [Bacteroidetes bacterium]
MRKTLNSNRISYIRIVAVIVSVQLIFTFAAFSQTITVSGKVTDAQTKEGIPGVTVIVKGTSIGTVTNIDGAYSINVPSQNSVIVYSFIGYSTQEISVDGKSTIDVLLEISTTQLDEVVAIGYGTIKKRDITGSVASVKGEELAAIPVASVEQAITGKLAGVQVLATEGSPDAEIKIRVRGGGSITQDNSPLFIVDGFPVNSINDIASSDIQSIDVLKDASSTAIYGSRGANGVIIVTTRSGKAGKLSVGYNAYYGVKKIAKTLDVLSVEDYVNWQYEYAVLDNGTDDLSSYEKYYGSWQDKDMYAGKIGNNWQEQVYGRTGEVFNHDLSVRGGTEKMTYSFNYAHINEKAIMVGSDFKRDNVSFKLNHNPIDKIQLAYSFRYSDTKVNGSGTNEQNEASSADPRLKHSVTYSPIPLEGLTTDDTDESIASYLINPLVATADNDREQLRKNYNMAGSFAWDIIDDLQFKTEVGLDNYYYNDNRFYGLTTYYVSNTPAAENQDQPAIILRDRKQQRFRNTNTLAYDFSNYFSEDHSLKLLLGEEMIFSNVNQLTSVIHGFPVLFTFDQALKLTTQGVAHSTDNDYSPDDKLLSFFGRLNYDFRNKYLISATFRADGSSKFSEGNRWGYFPSAAVAWRVSEEGFMQNVSWLDDLKLRFSYGTAGNNNIPSGQMTQSFESRTSSWMNGFDSYWAASKTMANPDLKWETTYTRNIGIDYAILKSRLNGTVELYFNTTRDLLIEFPVAGTGYDTQFRNMGETQNKGVEVAFNWAAIEKKEYGLNFSFNIGINRNKINSLGIMEDFGAVTGWASTEIGNDFWISKGGSVGEMYGYLNDGRYEVSDFERYDEASGKWILKDGVADNSTIVGNLSPGMLKLKNLNPEKDNKVTTEDQKIIGNANPKNTGGLTINGHVYGFDLTAAFNWSYGNDIYNANKIEYTSSTVRYQYRNLIDMMGEGKRWKSVDDATGQLITD